MVWPIDARFESVIALDQWDKDSYHELQDRIVDIYREVWITASGAQWGETADTAHWQPTGSTGYLANSAGTKIYLTFPVRAGMAVKGVGMKYFQLTTKPLIELKSYENDFGTPGAAPTQTVRDNNALDAAGAASTWRVWFGNTVGWTYVVADDENLVLEVTATSATDRVTIPRLLVEPIAVTP